MRYLIVECFDTINHEHIHRRWLDGTLAHREELAQRYSNAPSTTILHDRRVLTEPGKVYRITDITTNQLPAILSFGGDYIQNEYGTTKDLLTKTQKEFLRKNGITLG